MRINYEHKKIHHDLNSFVGADDLYWYTGMYLSLPRVFMSLVRKKMVDNPNVYSILIPLYTVQDPVTGSHIAINITDRYFFVSSHTDLKSEFDIGIGHVNSVMLLRNNDNASPTKITPRDIQHVIHTNIQQRQRTIQQDVMVQVTEGTFKEWCGIIENPVQDNREVVRVRFSSDEYNYTTDIPTVLCKAAC